MDAIYLTQRLSDNSQLISQIVSGVSKEQASWKPNPEKWSILEVLNHLYDEEKDDFRKRLDLLLHQPEADWPAIDPPKWVTERKYNERDLHTSLNNFITERNNSITWLETLSSPKWDTQKFHPVVTLSAGDLLASWVAHDFLHLRQLTMLHLKYVIFQSKPYSVGYASPEEAEEHG